MTDWLLTCLPGVCLAFSSTFLHLFLVPASFLALFSSLFTLSLSLALSLVHSRRYQMRAVTPSSNSTVHL